jgi:hypothetical protein
MENNLKIAHAFTELLDEPPARFPEVEARKTGAGDNRPADALRHLRARFGNARERFPDIYEGANKKIVSLAKYTEAAAHKKDDQSLSVVMVYNDRHAAVCAVEALERLRRKFRGQVRQRLTPVPIAQLSDPSRFDHLLFDASSADMLIVSFNGPGDFPATLKKWIEECFQQKRTNASTIVALLSSNERVEAPDSPRYQFLKDATWSAGLDFFAHGAGAEEAMKFSGHQPAASAAKAGAHAETALALAGREKAKRTRDAIRPRGKQNRIVAWADVGWGNSIYVRGGGGGLAWDIGEPMICLTGDQWVWSYPADAGPREIKFLRNDTDWALGENNQVLRQKLLVLTPQFAEFSVRDTQAEISHHLIER